MHACAAARALRAREARAVASSHDIGFTLASRFKLAPRSGDFFGFRGPPEAESLRNPGISVGTWKERMH